MLNFRSFCRCAAATARLMVGVPDYQNYVEHRRRTHPGEPVMTYEEFYLNRLNARYTIDKDRLRGCC
jgi:uncharacterized short protein YbdD (DUF466 family)